MSMTAAERLCDAQEKLHQLQTGRLSVEVEVDGRKVRYNRTTVADLQGYIDALNAEVANRVPRYGAIGFTF